MGAWGSSLYANDTTCDVRDTYMNFLQEQLSDENVYKKTFEKFQEYIGEEDEPLFWYALADTQWKVGRLMPEVKEEALKWLANSGGLSLWEESKSGGAGWKKTLEKLKNNLESSEPKIKLIKKPVEFDRAPWNIGDVYAYQFHTDIAKERGLFEKYILIQKVVVSDWFGWLQSIIQVVNKVFDEVPTLRDIDGLPILPLAYPPGYKWMPKSMDDYVPSFDSYLRAVMDYYKKTHYPSKHLTFIGNSPVPNIRYHRTQYTDLTWSKDEMDDWLGDFYLQWQGFND